MEKEMETPNYSYSGIPFKSDRLTSDSAPDYKGNIHIECEQSGNHSHRTPADRAQRLEVPQSLLRALIKPYGSASPSGESRVVELRRRICARSLLGI
jgi:hypothetical protein